MNKGVHVASVEAVHDFRLRLKRFLHDIEEALTAADAEALRRHAQIEEAVARATGELHRCEEQVARARADLAACRTGRLGEEGRPPDCGAEEESLNQAGQKLADAKERLAELVSASSRLEAALAAYRQRAFTLRAFLQGEMSRGDDFLAAKLAALEAYLAVPAPMVSPLPACGREGGPNARRSPAPRTPNPDATAGRMPPPVAADYRRLRSRTPSPEIRRLVNPPGPKVDPVYGHAVARLDADHIVPVREIVRMPGFSDLPDDKKVAVLNLPRNFLGVSREVNASRGGRSWEEYEGHARLGPIPPQAREEMIARTKLAGEAIRRAIEGGGRA